MEIIKFPKRTSWNELLKRPTFDFSDIEETVKEVFKEVEENGDEAILKFTKAFDSVELKNFRISEDKIKKSKALVSEELRGAINIAYENIRLFHAAQKEGSRKIETTTGVECWWEDKAIQNVGLYIPGGTAPLFSTVLMLGIPAQIAGCKRVVLCSPPNKNGEIANEILYAASLCGIDEIYMMGGIQAIAALSLGTETIEKVNKIFGPGNQYVTLAKQFSTTLGTAIDMPAGPSELLVYADVLADSEFVASDLLSQAEHGVDSQVICLSDSEEKLYEIKKEISIQLEDLPRKEIALKAIENSKLILIKDEREAVEMINAYAPEHLILNLANTEYALENIINAGSVFIGNYTPESAGDYASGTNHTLPTNGFAKAYSGVNLAAFQKRITYQRISEEGIQSLGPAIMQMAKAEGLEAHSRAVETRLKKLIKND